MSRESDIAWAAGIVDGEGCISLLCQSTSGYTQYVLNVVVVNTSLLMIQRLKEIFGVGAVMSRKSSKAAWRPTWVWQVTTKNAEQVLNLIEPYLVNKREEARLASYSRKLISKHGNNKQNTNMVELASIKTKLSELKRA